MEASTVIFNHSIVHDVLDYGNYKTWSSCVRDYLLGNDLWDVTIEPAEETKPSSSNPSEKINYWRKKNALALHAIKMACGPNFLSVIVDVNSAKEAWDILAAVARSENKVFDADNAIANEHTIVSIQDRYDYNKFIKAASEDDLIIVRQFIDSHPQVPTERLFPERRIALHHVLELGQEMTAEFLVNHMTEGDLEIVDQFGFTSLAVAARQQYPSVLRLLQLMVTKNPRLANMGSTERIPVIAASRGLKDTTRYLYGVTDKHIFAPQGGIAGTMLLINFINITLFDLASDLVQTFPKILLQEYDGISPIYALAKRFSAFPRGRGHQKSRHWMMLRLFKKEEIIYKEAFNFLRLVHDEVSTFDINTLADVVYPAMIEAARNGNIQFINEMLSANPYLIRASDEKGNSMFWHAVVNRRENVFNLIYGAAKQKDALLWCNNTHNNNILHVAALLAPSSVYDRTLGPVLQMKRELQWFKEVGNVAKPRYREELNKDNLTPLELFSKSHEIMMDAGQKWMKETAQSYSVVGALIITIMFAVVITVPGGNNQDTGYPLFKNEALFKFFILFDSLSLLFSSTSLLVFLGIFTSNYAEEDFLISLPRKLLIGVLCLFLSIATMMVTFCTALAIMFDMQMHLFVSTLLLACVPIVLFSSTILPLLSKVYTSTFGLSMFDRNTKLPEKKTRRHASDVDQTV